MRHHLIILLFGLRSSMVYSLKFPNLETADPVVKTQFGSVQGQVILNSNGKITNTFLGVPYATPPLGKLRFKHPLPPKPWEGILKTQKHSNICAQRRMTRLLSKLPGARSYMVDLPHSEDCLYLNIFAPKIGTSLKAVMVFIHGGSFNIGTASSPIYDPTYLAAEEDVVVVTINYRVSSFGFIFLDNSEADKNCGLMDQVMSLQWIRDSISGFGGDPEKVTLFGQSAGGMSIGFHLFSPLSSGLFARGIMQSGAILDQTPTRDSNEMLQKTLELAENLGCWDLSNHTSVFECLQAADFQEVVDSQPQNGLSSLVFLPVIDGLFLTEHPLDTMKKGNFSKKDILLGVNKNEGTLFLATFSPFIFSFVSDDVQPTEKVIKKVANFLLQETASELTLKAAVYEYTDWENRNDSKSILQNTDHMINDLLFTCPCVNTARYFSSGENTTKIFTYLLVHRSHTSEWAKWFGVQHGEDNVYVFGHGFKNGSNFPLEDLQFSETIMRYWANFAREGDPNISPKDFKPISLSTWPNYTEKRQNFLVLAPNSTSVVNKLRAKKCAFWEDFIPYVEKN